MKRRLIFLLFLFATLVFSFSSTLYVPAYADMVYGTPWADTIIITSGIDPEGVKSYGGNDSVTVTPDGAVVNQVEDVGQDADARAIGIDAGHGKDMITNFGTIDMKAEAEAHEASSRETARSIGIDGGNGHDEITNAGTITVNAMSSSASTSATTRASATGIDADNSRAITDERRRQARSFGKGGHHSTDMAIKKGDGRVRSSAFMRWISHMKDRRHHKPEKSDHRHKKKSGHHHKKKSDGASGITAVGIDGGDGNDSITNNGKLQVQSDSAVKINDVTFRLIDSGDVSRQAVASAKGVAGGHGNDMITNNGQMTVTTNATVNITDVNVALIGGATDVDSSNSARSGAIGIDGGDGKDHIVNHGPTTVTANAVADSDRIKINLLNALQGESARAPLRADAMAGGILGGNGSDKIGNTDTLHVTASATADALDLEFSAVDLSSGETTTTSEAAAIGIDGGKGKDEIVNTGEMTINANATTKTKGFSVSLIDLSLIPDLLGTAGDTSTTSKADVTGMNGGDDKDKIANLGSITAAANAKTSAFEMSWSADGVSNPAEIFDFIDFFREEPVIDASTTAEASAIGIDSGKGDDEITNSGTLTAQANADVSSTTLSVDFPFPDIIPITLPGIDTTEVATASSSRAKGVTSAEGRDAIRNEGIVSAEARSKATSLAVGVTLQPSLGGGDQDEDGGFSYSLDGTLVDVGAQTEAEAMGIETARGDDRLLNLGSVTAKATADSSATDVEVSIAQSDDTISASLSLGNASTEGTATATGITSGWGHDVIVNEGDVLAETLADTNSTTVSVDLEMLEDTRASIGAIITKAHTEANARSEGVNAGSGDDVIHSSGSVTASASTNADADGVIVDVSVQPGKDFGLIGEGAWASTDTIASVEAEGISGGQGEDKIWNEGSVETDAKADAHSVSVSVTAAGTKKGASIGVALTQANSEAEANGTGISGGADEDKIINSGMVKSKAISDVEAESVSVALALTDKGVALTGTAADGSTKGKSTAKGITGDDGMDYIRNEDTVDVYSNANATSVAVSVSASGAAKGVGLGVALSRATSEAEAINSGISGGAGHDKISNSGLVRSHALSTVIAGSGALAAGGTGKGVTLEGAAADGSTTGSSTAMGITGDRGKDTIYNDGRVDVFSDTKATSVSVAVSANGTGTGVTLGVALARAASEAEANSSGISGGADNDTIINSNLIKSHAFSDVTAVSVSAALGGTGKGVALEGAAADAATLGTSTAIGISGDHGMDNIRNDDTVDVLADADATSVSVAVSASGTGAGVGAGISLARADTRAVATSTGISLGGQEENDGNDHDDGHDCDDDGMPYKKRHGYGRSSGYMKPWMVKEHLENFGPITARSIADANSTSISVQLGVTGAGLQAGAALADASTMANATSDGIEGSDHQDVIVNHDTIDVRSDAEAKTTSVSVSFNVSLKGATLGAAITDATSRAIADSKGIAGMAGNDLIDNLGSVTSRSEADSDATSVAVSAGISFVPLNVAVADSSAIAESSAFGIDGGYGDDSIGSAGTILADADSESEGISVSVAPIGVSIASANVSSYSTAVGIEGGEGDDVIHQNEMATLDAKSTSKATGTVISATLLGAAGTLLDDAETTADAQSIGIFGGDGYDRIANMGAVTTESISEASGTSVSVSLVGAALADSSTTATSHATGISSGDRRDKVYNKGTISASSDATAKGVSVAAGLVGYFKGDASTTVNAITTGIDLGSGNDAVLNDAAVDVKAKSLANSISGSGTFAGVTEAKASSTANATATGIDGGDGNDKIKNRSSITVSAGDPLVAHDFASCTPEAGGARAKSLSVSVGLIGGALADASSTANAAATGLDGGDGHDMIENTGELTVNALARGNADGTSVSLFGVSNADAASTTNSIATAIQGGVGDDCISNDNSINVNAASETFAKGVAFAIAGIVSSHADTITNATATGINGGDGGNAIFNLELGSITVKSSSTSTADSSSWNFAGGSASEATLTATTRSTGIAGGGGEDWIHNKGYIDVDTQSNLSAYGGGKVIFGGAKAGSKIAAETTAVGIEGGGDDDHIKNLSVIDVRSIADMLSDTTSVSFAGSAFTEELVRATAQSTGITSGTGVDWVLNGGNIIVDAISKGRSKGSAEAKLAGGANASGNVAADVIAVGVDSGSENNVVNNTGSIHVTATVQPWATHSSDAGVFFSDGGTVAKTRAGVEGYGVSTGDGNGTIYNAGDITVSASSGTDDWDGNGMPEGVFARADAEGGDFDIFLGQGDAEGKAVATANIVEAGISAGDGNNRIVNEGIITVETSKRTGFKVTAFTDPNGGAVTIDGDGAGTATADINARAVGIWAGHGENRIMNYGDISITLQPLATAGTDADGGSSGDADAAVTASIAEYRWKDEHGQWRVSNTPPDDFEKSREAGEASLLPGAIAAGIWTGNGDNRITNRGTITVTTNPVANGSADVNGEDLDGDGTATVRTYAVAQAVGILTGDGDNRIVNKSTLTATARPEANAQAVSDADATTIFEQSDSTANATVRADSILAAGIWAGNGENKVINKETITVTAAPQADKADADALSFGDSDGVDAFATAVSSAHRAKAVGIWVGDGNNDIRNSGKIRVEARPRAIADAFADGSGYDGDAEAEATARTNNAFAVGILAGDGNSEIFNDGDIRVTADAIATAIARASPGSNFFNDGEKDKERAAAAVNNTQAAGIQVGNGDNWVTNTGFLNITAGSTASSSARDGSSLASSYAFGIRTGNGNNHLANKSVIDVTATASAERNGATQSATATAIGIKTGDGNDEISNYGTINTKQIVNGTTSLGTVIDSGGGDDTVLLGDGSVANGTIDLGADDDRLHLFGTPVVNGSALGGDGTEDSVVFDGAGSFTSPLQGFETATKKGCGTFTVTRLSTMRRLEVHQGTLQIDSDYQMSAESTFQAKVDGNGTHGTLAIGGTATVDGALAVIKGRHAFRKDATYDVLTASHVDGAFATEDLPDPTPLLSFSVEQQPTAMQVQASVNSFSSVADAGNEVEQAVAQCLDKILPTATGDLSEMLGSLQGLASESDIESAVTSLSPESYESSTTSILATVQRYVDANHDRMAALRAEVGPRDRKGRGMFLPGDQPILHSSTSMGLVKADTPFGAWLMDFDDNGGRGGLNSGYQSFNYDITGVDMGFDYPLGERSIMGTSFASTFTDLDLDSDLGDGEIDSFLTSIYGTHFLDDRTYVESVLSFGHSESSNIRRVGPGSMQRTALSTHDGDVVSAFAETGRVFGLGAWRSEVFGSLLYTSLYEEGFEETGAGGGDLIVEERRTESLVSELGFRVGRPFETNLGLLMPQLSIAWAHDFDIDDREITARFSDSPGTAFTVKGRKIDRDALRLGGVLTLTGSDELAVSAKFNADLSDNNTEVSGFIQLQFRF